MTPLVLYHVPELANCDPYVRLQPDQLGDIAFEHNETQQDADVLVDATSLHGAGISQAGWTEWKGQFSGQDVSIRWDWVLLENGEILILPSVGPRTNIKIHDATGFDLPYGASEAALLRFVADLEWQCHVYGTISDSIH